MAGSRSLGVLTVDLIAKVGGFESGMNQAERQSAKTAKAIKSQHQELARQIDGIYRKIGASLVAYFSVGAIKQSIDGLVQTVTLASKAGLPVDQFSAVSAAAKAADVDVQTLATSIGAASKALAAAKGSANSTQGRAFAALGIDPSKVTDAHDLILKAADALSQYQDGMGKTAVEMVIFGRAGADLNQMLNQGADGIKAAEAHARALNTALGPDAQQIVEQYKAQYDELSATLEGLQNTIAIAIMPTLTDFARALIEVAQQTDVAHSNTGSLASDNSLRSWFQSAALGAAVLIDGLRMIALGAKLAITSFKASAADIIVTTKSLGNAVPFIGQKLVSDADVAAAKKSQADLYRVGQEQLDQIKNFDSFYQKLKARIDKGLPAIKPPTPPKPNGNKGQLNFSTGDGGAGKEKAEKPVKDYTAALQDQIAQLTMTTTAYNVWKAAQDGANESQQDGVRVLSDQLQALQANKKAVDELNSFLEQHKAVIQGVSQAHVEFDDYIKQINNAMDRGALSTAAYDRLISDAFQNLADASKTSTDEMSEYAKRAAQNMQDAFANFLFDPFKDGVGGMFDNFANMLRQMAAQALASEIFGMLGGGKKGESPTGFLGSLFGAIFGSGHAGGGPVMPGMIYPVNERGPELLTTGGRDYLMTGSAGGNITPNNKLGGTTVNVMVQPTSTRQTATQVANATARGLQLAGARA